jgi:hypothetical protein
MEGEQRRIWAVAAYYLSIRCLLSFATSWAMRYRNQSENSF